MRAAPAQRGGGELADHEKSALTWGLRRTWGTRPGWPPFRVRWRPRSEHKRVDALSPPQRTPARLFEQPGPPCFPHQESGESRIGACWRADAPLSGGRPPSELVRRSGCRPSAPARFRLALPRPGALRGGPSRPPRGPSGDYMRRTFSSLSVIIKIISDNVRFISFTMTARSRFGVAAPLQPQHLAGPPVACACLLDRSGPSYSPSCTRGGKYYAA